MARPVCLLPELSTGGQGWLWMVLGSLLWAQQLELRHLGEDALLARMRPWAPLNLRAVLGSAGTGAPFLLSINQKLQVALLGSLPSQPDAQGSTGWGLPRISCHYLTHCKLLFMNSGRKQSRESHCLVTTDILVRCSLHSARARLGLPGTENPQPWWAAVPWPQPSASASGTPLRAETQMEVGEVP